MPTCRGVDISAYQGPQDWAAHKRDSVVFAWVKASEGQRTRDRRFDAHIAAVIKAGLVPGAYHFAWPNQDAAIEANNYIGAVKPYASANDFVHWLDLERYSDGHNYRGRTDAQIREWAEGWIARVQAAFPRQRVGVYTSRDDIGKGHLPPRVPLWYPQYPWGAAPYSRAEAAEQPRPHGRTPLFWQFTSQPLDRNICYLSAAQLRAWAAGDEEDDVALSPEDINKIADAVFRKLAAGGGVLENSDLDRIIDRDHVPAARPPWNNGDYFEADGKTPKNTMWRLGYALQTGVEAGRETLARVKAIEELLAALDPTTLVARLAGLEVNVTVTKPEGEP
ncbi:glycoside hydrolase family 25 protein [Streptomyces sp. UG1]|uniref:glycoside hydrolase family 25 protein n=1 Tax=Streptomyces sp. UG1 TaxID=3417652 RepID=UPI003CF9AD14